jgi:predicted nucleic acid-binding protein
MLGEIFVTATVATSSELSAAALEHRLHAGEFSALAWAEAFGADLFVTDDTLARLAARNLGYATTGTIGVILGAEKAGVLARSDAIALLGEIHLRTTLHVRIEFLNRVIASLR